MKKSHQDDTIQDGIIQNEKKDNDTWTIENVWKDVKQDLEKDGTIGNQTHIISTSLPAQSRPFLKPFPKFSIVGGHSSPDNSTTYNNNKKSQRIYNSCPNLPTLKKITPDTFLNQENKKEKEKKEKNAQFQQKFIILNLTRAQILIPYESTPEIFQSQHNRKINHLEPDKIKNLTIRRAVQLYKVRDLLKVKDFYAYEIYHPCFSWKLVLEQNKGWEKTDAIWAFNYKLSSIFHFDPTFDLNGCPDYVNKRSQPELYEYPWELKNGIVAYTFGFMGKHDFLEQEDIAALTLQSVTKDYNEYEQWKMSLKNKKRRKSISFRKKKKKSEKKQDCIIINRNNAGTSIGMGTNCRLPKTAIKALPHHHS